MAISFQIYAQLSQSEKCVGYRMQDTKKLQINFTRLPTNLHNYLNTYTFTNVGIYIIIHILLTTTAR